MNCTVAFAAAHETGFPPKVEMVSAFSEAAISGVQIVTRVDHPELQDEAATVFRERWPEFIFHDAVAPVYMPRVEEYFARYNIFVLDDGAVVAGHSWR